MKKRDASLAGQLNARLTLKEVEEVDAVGQTLWAGKRTRSEVGRFLVQFALEELKKAKIERTVVTVNGKVIV
jgi:hypothetical protein